MKITDYVDGMAYIFLRRSDFKDGRFDEIVDFLNLPKNTDFIVLNVSRGSFEGR